jgi:hypothetical protein
MASNAYNGGEADERSLVSELREPDGRECRCAGDDGRASLGARTRAFADVQDADLLEHVRSLVASRRAAWRILAHGAVAGRGRRSSLPSSGDMAAGDGEKPRNPSNRPLPVVPPFWLARSVRALCLADAPSCRTT